MRQKLTSLGIALGLALSCSGQEIRMTGPSIGLVFDQPSQSLRQIAGMPGAARLGDALVEAVDWASVSPDGRTALFTCQGVMRLLTLGGAEPNVEGVPVDGAVGSPTLAAWTKDASSVVLYSPAARSVQRVRLGAQLAVAEPPIELAGVEGTVTHLQAGGDSEVIVLAVAGIGVYRIGSSQGASLLASVADTAALAIDGAGKTLWVADRSNAQVLQISNLTDGPEVTKLVADPEKLSDLSALALSSNSQSLYLADRATRKLYVLDRSSNALSDGVELDMPATAITPLGRPSVFWLGQREKAGEPLYVLDDSAGPAVFFVPAGEGR
jgi:hypothetical protein